MLWKLIRLNEIMWAITPDSLTFGNQDAPLVNGRRDEETEEPMKEEECLENAMPVSQSKSLFLERVANCAKSRCFAEQMEGRIRLHILEYGGQV